MTDKLNKRYLFWFATLIIALLIIGGLLNIWTKNIKKNNLKNLTALNQLLPGFNEQSLGRLLKETKNLKTQIVNLSDIFDPKERWFKKDYDLSIYFVEELGAVNQSLKTKALDKQVDFIDLGFKEKLPSEEEAGYLLSQLYGLKEIVSSGIDYSIGFKSLSPLGIEGIEDIPEIKLAKSRIELSCPAQGLTEFIIELNDIIPKPLTAAFSLKSQDSFFQMSLNLEHIIVDLNWKDRQEYVASEEIKKELLWQKQDQNFIRLLRTDSPFLVAAKEISLPGQIQGLKIDKSKQLPMSLFLYKGKAVLRSKDVVLIEDTLNQETLFLGKGEKINNFILKEFSNEKVVLKNIDTGQELIIKREE
jgi:hypothetical protein